jgi:hypothetical protein
MDSIDDRGRPHSTRVFRGPWNDRFTFVASILGSFHPYFVLLPCLKIPKIIGVGRQGASSINATYINALITCEYYFPDNRQLVDGVYYKENLTASGEFLTLPATQMTWDSGGLPIVGGGGGDITKLLQDGSAPSQLVRMLDYTKTIYNVASITSNILSFTGNINTDSFSTKTLGLTFPPSQLLYEGCSLEPIANQVNSGNPTGSSSLVWNITEKFKYRPQDWNLTWNPLTQTWDKVYTGTPPTVTQVKPYASSTFSGDL